MKYRDIRKAQSLVLNKAHLRVIAKLLPGDFSDAIIALCDFSDAIEDGTDFAPPSLSQTAELAFDLFQEQVAATTNGAIRRSITNANNRAGRGNQSLTNDNDRSQSLTNDDDRSRSLTNVNDRCIQSIQSNQSIYPSFRPNMNDHSYVPAPAEDGTDGRTGEENEPDEGNAAFSRKQAAALFEAEGVKLTPGVWNELEHTFPPSDRRGAVDALLGNIRAATQPIDNVPAFLMHVLRRWKAENVQTVKQARESDERFLHHSPPPPPPSSAAPTAKPFPVDPDVHRVLEEQNQRDRERWERERAERETRRNGGDKQ